MLGQPAARGCQPDPPPVRLGQRGVHLAGECGDLLRHRGGGDAERVRDRAHRPQPGQLRQELQAAGFPFAIVRLSRTECPLIGTWTRTTGRRSTGPMGLPTLAPRPPAPQPPAGQPAARRQGGALMAVASMSCVQLGLALSVHLFGQLGPLGIGRTAAGLGRRPAADPGPAAPARLHRPGPAGLRALGVVTAGLMMFFMLAIARIPLGTASALEFLGPLAVSLLRPGGGRKRWAVLAAAGVVLLTQPWHGGIDPAGLALRPRRRRLLGRLHPADPARRRPGHRPERAGRLDAGGRHRRRCLLAAAVRSWPGDLAAACRHAGRWPRCIPCCRSASSSSPCAAHREGLRHPDEPGTRDRAAGRPARTRAGPERGGSRGHPVRGHRRNRRHPHRRQNAQARDHRDHRHAGPGATPALAGGKREVRHARCPGCWARAPGRRRGRRAAARGSDRKAPPGR